MSINFVAKVKDPEGNIVAKIDLGWDISHINDNVIRFLWGTDGLRVRDFKNLDDILNQYPEIKTNYIVDLTSINELLEVPQDSRFYDEIQVMNNLSNKTIRDYLQNNNISKGIKEVLLKKIESEDFELSGFNKVLLGVVPMQDTINSLLDSYKVAKKGDLDELSNDIILLVSLKPESYFKKAYEVISDIYAEELITAVLKSSTISREYKFQVFEEHFPHMRGALVSNIRSLKYNQEMVTFLLSNVSSQEVLYMVKNNNFLRDIPNETIKDVVEVIIDLDDIYSNIRSILIYLRPEQIQKIVSRSKSVDVSELLSDVNLDNRVMISLISSGVEIDSDFFALPITKKDKYIFNLAIANYQPGWSGVCSEVITHPFLDSNIIEKYAKKFSSLKTLEYIYRHRNELITEGILKHFKKKALEKMDFRYLSLIKEWNPEEQEIILKNANKNAKTSFTFFDSTKKGDAIRSKLITKMVTSPDIMSLLEDKEENFTEEELERIYNRIAKTAWTGKNLSRVLRLIPKEKYPLLLEKYSWEMAGIADIYKVLSDENIVKMLKNVTRKSYFGYHIKQSLPEDKLIMCFQKLPANNDLLKKLYEDFIHHQELFNNKDFRASEFYKEISKDYVVSGYSKKDIKEMRSWRVIDAIKELEDNEKELFAECYLEEKLLSENEELAPYLSRDYVNKKIREEIKDNEDINFLKEELVDKLDSDLLKEALKKADYYDLREEYLINKINNLGIDFSEIVIQSKSEFDYRAISDLCERGAIFSEDLILEFVKIEEISKVREIFPAHIKIFKEYYKNDSEALSLIIDMIEADDIKKHFNEKELVNLALMEEDFYIHEYINCDLIPEEKLDISNRKITELVTIAKSNKYGEKVKDYILQNVSDINDKYLTDLTEVLGNEFLNQYIKNHLDRLDYTVDEDAIQIDPWVVLAELEDGKLIYKKGLDEKNKTLISQLFYSLKDNVYYGKLDTRDHSINFEGNNTLLKKITKEGVSDFIDSSLEYILNSDHIELGVIPVKICVKNGNVSIAGTGDFLGSLFSQKIEKIKKKIIEKSEEFSVELNNMTSSIDRKFTLSIEPKEYCSSDILEKALIDTDSKNGVNAGTRAHKHAKDEWRIIQRRRGYSHPDKGGKIMSPIFSDTSGLNEIKGVCERLADKNVSGRITVSISISDLTRKISNYYDVTREIKSVSGLLNPFINEDIDIGASSLCIVEYNHDSKMVKFRFDTKVTYDNIVHFIELACSLTKAAIYKITGKQKESNEYITSLSEEAFLRRFHKDLESEEMTNMVMLYELVGENNGFN